MVLDIELSLKFARDVSADVVDRAMNRIVGKVSVALRRSRLSVTEHLGNDRKAVIVPSGDTGEGMSKIVKANVFESGFDPDVLPCFLQPDIMSAAIAWEDKVSVGATRNGLQDVQCIATNFNDFRARLAVGKSNERTVPVDVTPTKGQDFRLSASGQHQQATGTS